MAKEDWTTVSIPRALINRIQHAIDNGVLDHSNPSQFIAYASRKTLDQAIDRDYRQQLQNQQTSQVEMAQLLSKVKGQFIEKSSDEDLSKEAVELLLKGATDNSKMQMAEGSVTLEQVLALVEELAANEIFDSDEIVAFRSAIKAMYTKSEENA